MLCLSYVMSVLCYVSPMFSSSNQTDGSNLSSLLKAMHQKLVKNVDIFWKKKLSHLSISDIKAKDFMIYWHIFCHSFNWLYDSSFLGLIHSKDCWKKWSSPPVVHSFCLLIWVLVLSWSLNQYLRQTFLSFN